MRTALDAPIEDLDPGEREFVRKIREHGWHRMNVFADREGPGFSYTTGHWLKLNHPEIIVFGLDASVAGKVLWDIYEDMKGGQRFPIGRRISGVFSDVDAYLTIVAKKNFREYLGWSRWFYGGDDFECVQLIWPDKQGRFPWNEGVTANYSASQPDLTERGWISSLSQ